MSAASSLSLLMARMRVIPDHHRSFALTARDASVRYGIGASLLGELLDAGLPSVDGELFDETDLANAAGALRLRSVWFLGQRGWAAALDQLRAGVASTNEIQLKPRCPHPGHAGTCEFSLLVRDFGGEAEATTGASGELTRPDVLTVRTTGAYEMAPPAVESVFRCLAGAHYLHLPETMDAGDLDFFDRTGAANCVLAAAAVLRQARRDGVAARRSFGVIVTRPFAGTHTWVEFRVGGRWVAYDPFLIRHLEACGVLAPGQWPALGSVSGILLRLGEVDDSLATHCGLHAAVAMPVRWVS